MKKTDFAAATFASLAALAISACLLFALVGCGSSEPEEVVYIEDSQIEAAILNPSDYSNKYINVIGKVYNKADSSDGKTTYEAYYDYENSGDAFVFTADSDTPIAIDDYVSVDGKIEGAYDGKGAATANSGSMMIAATAVEVLSYMDAAVPTIETLTPADATITQNGITLSVDKIEFAEKETRVYMTETNNSDSEFKFLAYSVKIIQDGKQIEEDSASVSLYEGGYEEIAIHLLAGATSSGILVFPALDMSSDFQIVAEGSSVDDDDAEFDAFTFDIEVVASA